MERYVIHITKQCNCDCLYCYEDDKTSIYTWQEIKELIDNIIKYRTNDTFSIEFLGGEPMLRWDLVKQAYEYLESLGVVNVEDYCITTNGTIMNEEIADYLSKNTKLRFAVSMDGSKWANQLRVFKESRVNTYDTVMQNIKYLIEVGVDASIHMVTHLYNVGFLAHSIDTLYKQGITNIGIGTIEKTMTIDENYCNRFIKELSIVSDKIISGEYKNLKIAELEYVKPYEDVRSYIKDPATGKVVAESYGRSGDDITMTATEYDVNRCDFKTDVSEMIYYIRKTVYDNHQLKLA